MNSTSKAVWASSIILGVIYLALLPLASNGYGYTGYRGYHGGPSFWYFGGPTTYHEPSNRNGSISGTNRIGGGPGSGK
jgi:hypothetical protein